MKCMKKVCKLIFYFIAQFRTVDRSSIESSIEKCDGYRADIKTFGEV